MTGGSVRHYDAQYGQFASTLYADVRATAFGENIGQNGWLTAAEHDLFIEWLGLETNSRLLDVASGSGRTTLRIARLTGCAVHGIDIHEQGISSATDAARDADLAGRATFQLADASRPLPFEEGAFDALICIDAINHLPDRQAVFREWARVLRPGGRLVFTDPIVVTGPLTNEEIAIRSSIGFFLFVPLGYDEQALANASLEVTERADRTENMARMAARWREARTERERDLRGIEGDATF
ncbi:MAG TPA: methyltransferase domain-containing protein, partial [Gemmatimonadaceae bacterium]|nr:methyltransferase domain-containing protein [Gemmatimonadaceae bacterium]